MREMGTDNERSRLKGRGRAISLAAVAVLSIGGLAACGDDDDEMTDQEKYCAAGDDLRTSLDELFNLDIVSTGTDGLNEAVGAVSEDLDELRGAAEGAAADEVAALDDAISDVGTAISDLSGELTAENATAIGTAIQEAGAAADAVYQTLTDCE